MTDGKFSSVAVKRAIYVVCIILFSVLQNSFLPALGFRIPVFFLIPLCVAIAMAEYEFTGLFTGLLAGALWDLISPVSDGIITLYLTIFTCAAGLLTHYIFRNTLISAFVLTSGGTVLFSLISIIFNCLTRNISAFGFSTAFFYIAAIILTTALTPAFYFPVKVLSYKYNHKKDRSVQ